MPSHKHKKKKKSHKRSKKHSSSSAEDIDEIPWRVALSDADSDESNNQERLTPLVRRTYLHYLKQALALNVEECIKHSNESYSESLDDIVHKWTSLLEQKAMRTSMISGLYRTSMVSLIRQIKLSTTDKKLFIGDKKLSKLKFKLPLNKGLQTDLIGCNSESSHTVETQTNDINLRSLIDSSQTKYCHCNRPYDPVIDFSDLNCHEGDVSSSLESKFLESAIVSSAHQDICNITSTSDIVHTHQFSTLGPKIDVPENTLGLSEPPENHEDMYKKTQLLQFENNETEIKLKKQMCDLKEIDKSNIETIVTDKKYIGLKKRKLSIEITPKNNLESRLVALGLFDDNIDGGLSHPVEKSKKSSWYAEETAQSCNLTRILLKMSTKKRAKVIKKFEELFGDDSKPLAELSEENITVCRKRIAYVVVTELTPMYQAKRIASRHLFKVLAKKITELLMEQSYAPDTRSIRWKVKTVFEDGKIIMSESDCM